MKRMKFERRRSRRWQAAMAKIRKTRGGNLWGMSTITVYPREFERTYEGVFMAPPPPHPRLNIPVIYIKANPDEKPEEFDSEKRRRR